MCLRIRFSDEDQTKAWLDKFAKKLPKYPAKTSSNGEDELPLFAINTDIGVTLCVAFNHRELTYFIDSFPYAINGWYTAKIEDLLTVSDLGNHRPDLIKMMKSNR